MHHHFPRSAFLRLAPAVVCITLLSAGACDDTTTEAEPIPDAGNQVDVDAGENDAAAVCDRDEDGVFAPACGGYDCNDDDFRINPDASEVCSFVDEDCDEENNENLDCTFVAAGEDMLYRIDPFAETVEVLTQVQLPDPDHGLLDIDIDPLGELLAVTNDGLYAIDDAGDMYLLTQVSTPDRTNGMAIDSGGTIFITNNPRDPSVDAAANTVNRYTGALTLLGALDPFVSSGDCVSLKDDSLLMTAPDPNTPYDPNNPEAREDFLVFVDSTTAETRAIGPTGHAKVYGLSASFDFLFGVTDTGKVLRIDSHTGAATLLFEAPGTRFWGAANGD